MAGACRYSGRVSGPEGVPGSKCSRFGRFLAHEPSAEAAKPSLPGFFPFNALGENNSPRHPSNLKDGSFAFEAGIHDISYMFRRSQKAVTTMSDAEFDGF